MKSKTLVEFRRRIAPLIADEEAFRNDDRLPLLDHTLSLTRQNTYYRVLSILEACEKGYVPVPIELRGNTAAEEK